MLTVDPWLQRRQRMEFLVDFIARNRFDARVIDSIDFPLGLLTQTQRHSNLPTWTNRFRFVMCSVNLSCLGPTTRYDSRFCIHLWWELLMEIQQLTIPCTFALSIESNRNDRIQVKDILRSTVTNIHTGLFHNFLRTQPNLFRESNRDNQNVDE